MPKTDLLTMHYNNSANLYRADEFSKYSLFSILNFSVKQAGDVNSYFRYRHVL